MTFIKLWQNRERLNEELSISIQLFRIAKTTLIDLLRKQNNLASLINSLPSSGSTSLNNGITSLDHKDTNRKLMQLIDTLPPVRKKVFEMNRLQGMPYKEIANKLSISIKTVEKHISKAIGQLRAIVDDHISIWVLIIIFIKLEASIRV